MEFSGQVIGLVVVYHGIGQKIDFPFSASADNDIPVTFEWCAE